MPTLKAEGVVNKGMIPKLDNSFRAIGSGVRSVIIKHAANLSIRPARHSPRNERLLRNRPDRRSQGHQ